MERYSCGFYADHSGSIKEDTPREIRPAIRRCVVIAPSTYALGPLQCVINTRWRITFVFVVQLSYVNAPLRLKVGRA